ncbi:MAG TPA: helix-turn-helix transcriptional regulator [Syntrophomonadaceae bacterium]|nr:helix-turn-helix transcriptional regulator [Syntrophomonadaceae bacterium]
MFDGKLMRDIREKKNLSQFELYELTGIKPEYISKVENNIYPNVGIVNLAKIADALECKVDDFMAKE